MQSIHIKVTARNSIRRFALTEAKLDALRQQVASLFDIKNDANWSIKYKDTERQLVTISSDDELEFAVKLMGNILHVVVVENGVDVDENSTQERKVRRHEKQCDNHRREKHRKSHHDESDDLVEKQHRNKRPINPETRLARLQKKQNKLRERLAVLQAAENPKAQSQATKVQQKLAAITSEIDSISTGPVSPPVSSQTVVAETFVVVPETTVVPAPTAELAVVKPVDPPALNDKEVKQVFNKFFSLRRELMSEKKKIHQLSKVIHALRVLSRLGEKANIPVKVDDNQLAQAKSSLNTARTNIRAKKMEVKQQKQLVKKLQKQGYMPDRKLENEKKDKKCKKEKNEKKCKKEKSWKVEDNASRQEAKAQWRAEKDKKREEKAAIRALKQQEREQKKNSAAVHSVETPQF
jgi:hypothetical protein